MMIIIITMMIIIIIFSINPHKWKKVNLLG